MIHTKLRNRLAMKKLHKLVYVHYNVRLRVKNLMQERSDKDLYNPIDLNHIFNDDDILDEWIREGEEPILSSDNLDWLDQDLPSREGREAARADDGGTSNRVSRRGSSIAQGREIGSSRKGKAPQIIVSNTSSDEGDDRANRRGSNIVGDSEDSEDTSGDNGAGGGIGASGAVDSGYVNQVDHGMSWAQGNENYYATQDTDHGYRPGIWEQRKHLEGLTTFPSDDDYSSGHDYRSNCNQIDEHFQSLALGAVPHFRGEGDRSYHNFGSSDNSSNAFSGYDFDQYSTTGTRASGSYGYDQSSDSSSVAYRGFGYYQHGVEPVQPPRPYFPNYGSSTQSSQPTHSSDEQFFQSHSRYANYRPDLYARRRTNDDDNDFEPPRHSTWY